MTTLATTRPLTKAVSLPAAIRSESIKFTGLVSNLALAGFSFALLVANALLMAWAYVFRDRSSPQADYDAYAEMMIDKTAYIGVLLAILAALLVTNEYRSGQIKTTFLSIPRRIPVILAKAALVAGSSFAIGVVSAGIGFAVAPAILASGGYGYDLTAPVAFRLILGSGLYLATLSLIGIAIGSLVRNVVASVLSVLTFLIGVPLLPQMVSTEGTTLTALFPIQSGSRLIAPPDPTALDPWIGYLMLLAWALALLTAAAVRVTRRDA